MRLLIVDPDSELLYSYCAYFDRVGWDTATATNGQQAKDMFLQRPVHAVVLEPDLPPDSGSLLLGTIADRIPRRPLPVVVVSRRSAFPLDFPVQDYHVKPVMMSVLVNSLKEAVGDRLRDFEARS